MEKEELITIDTVKDTPAGGVLIGEKEGQTIIPKDGSMGGFLIGNLHKESGIKAVNKSNGQPLEMQGNEVVITAPAVADQSKREFEGKLMTNREILSKINSDGGGVSFAEGGEIPAKINISNKSYNFEGQSANDIEIANRLGFNSTLEKGKQIFTSGGKNYYVAGIYKAIKNDEIQYSIKQVKPFAMKFDVYDKKYSESVTPDFNRPQGIIVKIKEGEELLIDGNHRMNNAYKNGLKTIPEYYVNIDDISPFVTNNAFDDGGHLSKGMTFEDIAKKHKVSLSHIMQQVAKGLEVEKEHFSSEEARTKIAKDHLTENPNYYTILEKSGLEKGGEFNKKENLVKDAKDGDTPARDLNNYNDLIDVQEDGVVGNHQDFSDNDGSGAVVGYANGGELYNSDSFMSYCFGVISDFLKEQNDVVLKDDYTFFYRGENFTIQPLLLVDNNNENPLQEASFAVLDDDGITMGEIYFDANMESKNFRAESEFFEWNGLKFKNGGQITELLAPNGKPSNLSPEQYNLVRTEAFKNWFGDWENSPETASKVVDENGEPLVVYHGTKTDFFEFELSKTGVTDAGLLGQGFYFTPSKQQAESFATSEQYGYKGTPKVMEVFLVSKKPEIISDAIFSDGTTLREVHPNGITTKSAKAINKKLLTKKFDGAIFKTDDELLQFFVFNPNQIKLADGTNVTFNPKTNDIRFEEGGDLDEEEDDEDEDDDFKNGGEIDSAQISEAIEVLEILAETSTKKEKKEIQEALEVLEILNEETGVLLAPNGQPSNLNPEQYNLVRTEAFKKWFGDWENSPETASKVVDGNGEPLVVYHGSKEKINEFKVINFSEIFDVDLYGSYFSETHKYAKHYATEDGIVYMVFLNIKNPYNLGNKESDKGLPTTRNLRAIEKDKLDFYKRENYDGIIFTTNDNIKYEIVVFEPNQIKIADGTNATFNPNTNDIRFDNGGEVKENKFGNTTIETPLDTLNN